MNKTPSDPAGAQPWWKFPMMWLVLGLPAAVIVAGFATLWIATARPDVVVDPDYYRKGLALGQAATVDRSQVPAQVGRNHAMTPDGGRHAQPALPSSRGRVSTGQ